MNRTFNCYIYGEPYRIKEENILEIMKVVNDKGFLGTFIEDIKNETDFLWAIKELLERNLIESEASLEDHNEWIEGNKKLLKVLNNFSGATILLAKGI